MFFNIEFTWVYLGFKQKKFSFKLYNFSDSAEFDATGKVSKIMGIFQIFQA
jgi:hypothetical protein